MQLKGKTWIFLTAGFWFFSGLMLLLKGLVLYQQVFLASTEILGPDFLLRMMGSTEKLWLFYVAIAVIVGFLKGRLLLSRSVNRILLSAKPYHEKKTSRAVFDRKYTIMLISMLGIGLAFKFLTIPILIRAFIDTAIGVALVQGAWLYCRGYLFSRVSGEST